MTILDARGERLEVGDRVERIWGTSKRGEVVGTVTGFLDGEVLVRWPLSDGDAAIAPYLTERRGLLRRRHAPNLTRINPETEEE